MGRAGGRREAAANTIFRDGPGRRATVRKKFVSPSVGLSCDHFLRSRRRHRQIATKPETRNRVLMQKLVNRGVVAVQVIGYLLAVMMSLPRSSPPNFRSGSLLHPFSFRLPRSSTLCSRP